MSSSKQVRHFLAQNAKFREVPRSADLMQAADKLADMLDGVATAVAKASTDSKLSPVGKLDEVRKHLGQVSIKNLANMRALSKDKHEDLRKWEARLVPATIDSEMEKEIRSVVRPMPAPEKAAFLARTDLPREVFAALAHGPEFLSGIDSKQRSALLQSYRATYHKDDDTAIAHQREALGVFDATVQMATNAVTDAGGFTPREFATFAEGK
jgi:hypothetical protein